MQWEALSSCPECGAGYGDPHWPACARARSGGGIRGAGYHSGQAAAIRECRARGWAVTHVPGEGLRPCDPDEAGSYVDLDRYAYWLEHGDASLHGNEPAGGARAWTAAL